MWYLRYSGTKILYLDNGQERKLKTRTLHLGKSPSMDSEINSERDTEIAREMAELSFPVKPRFDGEENYNRRRTSDF